MTIKFSSTATPRTWVAIEDAAARNLPNSDWCIGATIVMDGALAPATANYLVATGRTGDYVIMQYFVDATKGPYIGIIGAGFTGDPVFFTPEAGKAYVAVIQRKDNVLTAKVCPVLAANPTDGTAVLSALKTSPLTIALVSTGVPTTPPAMMFGERQNDRRLDHSMGRVFCGHFALTDLEIAKLAYGLEVTDLGKTPAWYYRLNDGSDVVDRGASAYPATVSTGATPLPTGAPANYGYANVNSVPTVTAPTINGTPQSGTSVTYTSGEITGFPYPAITQQWFIDGVAVQGEIAATYIPTPADVGKSLTVRQTVTNNQGADFEISAGQVIIAAANAVYVVPPAADRIFQRIGAICAVPFSGTYTGVQPASIEYQLYDPDGTTIRKAWASIGATIVPGGTWSAAPAIPAGAKKYRIVVRTKDAGGAVISTSAVHANRFGVGDLIACIGSSSAETWFYSVAGTTPNTEVTSAYRTNTDTGLWQAFASQNYAATIGTYLAGKLGVVIGMVDSAEGGTSMPDWLPGKSTWTNFVTDVSAVGGKLAGVFISLGSNDAGGGVVVSRAAHLEKLRTLVANTRSMAGDSNLPILLSGYNRRTATTKTAEVFTAQSNYVRMAEQDLAQDASVCHVQTLDCELSGDGIHLTTGAVSGFMTCANRIAYVWGEFRTGSTHYLGPKIDSMTYSSAEVTVTIAHSGSTDFTPSTGGTGFTVTDSDPSGIQPTISSIVRIDPTRIKITCNRALVLPVVQYLAGNAPPVGTPFYDNGSVPLPLLAESDMAAVAASETGDTTGPQLTGTITVSGLAHNSFDLTCPVATDAVGVTGYEWSGNGGTTWVNLGNSRTFTRNGLSESTNYQTLMRAYDAAGNRSTTLSVSVTTSAAPAPTRTVSVTLHLDAITKAANLTGIMVSFSAGTGPHDAGARLFASAGETTDANGVLTFTFNSGAINAGQEGVLSVLMQDKKHYLGLVAVA